MAGRLRRVGDRWRSAPVARRIGAASVLLLVAVAAFGPLIAPFSPTATVAAPFAGPSAEHLLGTDALGRDVLARVLSGGRTVVLLSSLSTALAYAIGAPIGLIAGWRRSWLDPVLMRSVDVLLAFPPIVFLLILAAGFGPNPATLVVAIAVIFAPSVARIVRAATQVVSGRAYVEAAVARGEPAWYVLGREILPNIRGPVTADVGVRITFAILLVAAVNYLGLGLRPPTADWALMISENRAGITLQPWSLVAPAVLIASLTLGVSLASEGRVRAPVEPVGARGTGPDMDGLGEAAGDG
jgi:peptide/nickel transport system permease protein